MDEQDALELAACTPMPLRDDWFNPDAHIPFGCTVTAISSAMSDFLRFIAIINERLNAESVARLETLLMPANFSSVVGEYINAALPRHCASIVRNLYHNGHPDLIPANRFPGDAVQYTHEGIEVKASRYSKGWQGHNAEASWLLVFVFDSNRPNDARRGATPRPFRFVKAVGAQLEESDWRFSGRTGESRRTITASVQPSGYAKMEANWIYRDAGSPPEDDEP